MNQSNQGVSCAKNANYIPTELRTYKRLSSVIKATGLSRSTILRGIKNKTFPAPLHYGKILLFSVDEVNEFMANLASMNNSNLVEQSNSDSQKSSN